MSKEQIIRKLTSRKFILAVALLIFGILCATGVIRLEQQEDWRPVFVSAAGIIAYILAEGGTDIAGLCLQNKPEEEEAND